MKKQINGRTFRLSEINEEHEIGVFFHAYECPLCGGQGACEVNPWDRTENWEECEECGGDGVIYLYESGKVLKTN